MTAAVTAASAAALANPLVAEAAMTPSPKNTLLSVVAGGIVLAAIGAAVIGVSTFDKIGPARTTSRESIAVARALAAGTRPIDGPPTASRGVRRG